MAYGIDVNSWEGSAIDRHAVRAHNITYWPVKTTEATSYTNPAATARIDGSRAAGTATDDQALPGVLVDCRPRGRA